MPQEASCYVAERAETAAVGGRAAPTTSIAATENSQYLVAVTTRKAELRKRKSKKAVAKKKRRKLQFALLLMIIIGLATALIIVSHLWAQEHQTIINDSCTTKVCIASSNHILQAMDKNTSPCEDFYQFACGNWIHEHPVYGDQLETSRFAEAKFNLYLEIEDILKEKNSHSDPLPVQQSRVLYKSCMDTDNLESCGLKPAIDILQDLGLPGNVPTEKTTEFFNITKTLALINYNLTITDAIFSIMVTTDPNNSSVRMLLITPPIHKIIKKLKNNTIVGPDPEYYAAKEKQPLPDMVKKELEYRSAMMALFEKEHNPAHKLNETKLKAAALKTMILEAHILKAMNRSAEIKVMNISELQSKIDDSLKQENLSDSDAKIDMKLFIKILFLQIPQSCPKNSILIYDVEFFQNIAVLLAKGKVQTTQRLMWWKVVDYLATLSTKEMRSLKYSKTNPRSSYGSVSRSKECLLQIHKLMPAAVGYKIATNAQFISTKKRVEEMLSDIKAAFISLVNEARWMDEKTKKEALIKVHAMGHMIGFPQDLVKPGYIEDMYNEVMVEEKKFLRSVINIHTANSKRMLSRLNLPKEEKHIRDDIPDPFIVNAFNAITFNFIVIPSGILRVPFYGLGLEALNYGAIGFVLAHELTHSFDNLGRNFDKDGQQKNWWTTNTTKEFEHRAGCFKHQYGKYRVRGKKVDGKRTLGENIADNGGLREAIRAYNNYVKRNGPEKKLPGLEEFTHEQLLYLAFANVWCSSTTKTADLLRLSDVHSPPHFRVIGTLSNMKEFVEAWQCPIESAMNPSNKCILW